MYRSRYPTLFYLLTFLLFITNASAECIDGDCRNGNGSFRYKGGNLYTGDFRKGKRQGRGVLEYAGGDRYEGEWNNDKLTGFGTYTWAKDPNERYVGQFRNGKRHGTGTYYYKNGNRYEGQWRDGIRDGYGTFTFATGSKDRYVGQFRDGNRHGMGTYYFENGNKYEGEWRDGDKQGLGMFTWGSGKSKGKKYLGHYANGVPQGPATYYNVDGSTRNVYSEAGKEVKNSTRTRLVGPPTPESHPLSAEQQQLQAEFGEPPHFKLYLVDAEGGAVQRNETWYYPAQRTWFTFVDGKFAASGPIEQALPSASEPAWRVAQFTRGLSPESAALMLLHQPDARLDLAPSMLAPELRASMTLIFSRGLVLGFSEGRLATASTLPGLQQAAQEVRP